MSAAIASLDEADQGTADSKASQCTYADEVVGVNVQVKSHLFKAWIALCTLRTFA